MMRPINVDAPMDPDAMLARLRLAMMRQDCAGITAAAHELRGWISHGGPAPTGVNQMHALIACRDALEWVDQQQQGQSRANEQDAGNPALDCGR